MTAATLGSYDCVAILTDHSSLDYAAIASASQVVVDTRNAIKGALSPCVETGFAAYARGEGGTASAAAGPGLSGRA